MLALIASFPEPGWNIVSRTGEGLRNSCRSPVVVLEKTAETLAALD
jgi:hypothetical protein